MEHPARQRCLYVFLHQQRQLFGERKDNGEVEKVVDWIACDVDSNSIISDRFGFLSDGRIVAVTYEYSDNDPSRQQVLVLNRVDAPLSRRRPS